MAKFPSSSELHKLLRYEPATGALFWRHRKEKANWNSRYAGRQINSVDSHGYIYFRLKPRTFRAHRAIWAMMTGRWPEKDIDHINGNRADNRWLNLREASRSQNNYNRHAPRSGNYPRGVSFHKASGLYRAYLKFEGRQISFGYFKTPDEAAAAFADKAPKYIGKFYRGGHMLEITTPSSCPIAAPGFFRLSAQDYHADVFCPAPSLSSSIAKVMIANSPRHAWVKHPRLNPDWQADDTNKALDFGSAAHRLLLGNGRDIFVIEHDDFRTKAAKEARDKAIAEGLTPLLAKDLARAEEMVASTREQLTRIKGCEDAFSAGDNEVVLLWMESEGWCRAMVDNLVLGHEAIVNYDFKSTSASAAPAPGSRRIFDLGYHLQAAFYERGIRNLIGDDDMRPIVTRFVMQETEPPYLLSVFEVDEEGREIGRKMAATALALWQRCIADNVWPGYPAHIVTAEIPPWAAISWLDREAASEMLRDAGQDAFDILARWSPPKEKKQQFVGPV